MLVGVGLRFWQLDVKPLWMDEVLTAIFTSGRSYGDIPTESIFAIAQLDQLFTVQLGMSCPQIAQTVATESVHPPLFFCLMYSWMSWLNPEVDAWVWSLRALPALFGVGAIAAMYRLNRIAFSAPAGLLAAALMAVSPFAVYLSQEARHYTLPMLLITLALGLLVQMQQDVQRSHLRPWVWFTWIVVNSLGLYTHYFCILGFVAQVVAFGGWLLAWRQISTRTIASFGLAIAGVGLSYLPWLTTVVGHFSRPETDWLKPYDPDWSDRIAPIYQTLAGWVLMVIALPLEPSWAIALFTGAVMVLFTIWLARHLILGMRWSWQRPSHQPALVLIGGFTLCVVAQFFVIVYGLDKDITAVPRYNFVYYPGVCALLGAVLASLPSVHESRATQTHSPFPRLKLKSSRQQVWAIALIAGLLSSGFVVQGWVFQKPYNPDEIAANMLVKPTLPLIVVTNYRSLQEIALGLSIALELRSHRAEFAPLTQPSEDGAIAGEIPIQFGFFDRRPQRPSVWRAIALAKPTLTPPLNLWVVSPEIRRQDYPPQLRLSNPAIPRENINTVCSLDPEEFHRLGFPYQLYRCQSNS